ncbi:glycoside hydrolase family 3 N-terminal domain-containing protein [Echinicola jeungdonensis]|uniref:beta-N-acetylhexosaminidase n=1 Tax=Echinicola jeungdonensis TaxID=709343 RepID=A0ABV5J4X4_9BACT|nr:glycoside hydrolase family 3 N-terminal domain-containing protein [Echinicola jeungdonensis]MDN3668760.1 glycoside hydrolase family 3 N-terminal domain-containing protein [Echinicola jeungdonensis]
MRQKVWITLLCIFVQVNLIFAFPKVEGNQDPLRALDPKAQRQWVDSVFNSMSFEGRLGQLFMVAAFSNKDQEHVEEISKLIQEENLGGLIFFQGGPVRQAKLTNHYQSISDTPLFIAMDAEWGISMRLDSVLQFPKQMTLGAIENDELIYKMGTEIARQFKAMGMHINFAPVVDVNSNPENPVIGYRAFGEEKKKVAQKALAYMKGLQDHGIMANAKHFPGHGDTDADSHFTTPVIQNSEKHISEIDLYPYRQLIRQDLMSVMVAHLHIPSLGTTSKLPSTLSKNVVTDLLKDDLGFEGLIFTDALNMKGVSQHHKPGEVDLLALLAGNDILLYSEDVPRSKKLILEAVKEGRISEEEIDERVRKVLRAKYWAGLNQNNPISTDKLVERVSTFETKALIEQLYAASITMVANKGDFLPLKNLDLLKMASITVGDGGGTFQKQLDRYGPFHHFTLPRNSSTGTYRALQENLKDYNTIVVGITDVSNNPKKDFGIKESDMYFIKNLSKKYNVITVLFGNAYAAKFLEGMPHVLVAYEENEFTEKIAPQIIFGARPALGSLPASVSPDFPAGTGLELEPIGRLGYSQPETQGMDSRVLLQIDEKVERAIAKKSTPGAIVLVAKNGKVVFEKAYGHHDYSQSRQVTPKTLYDIASITKVMATTQILMFLESRELIDMGDPIGKYLPELNKTNKGKLLLKDIMAHEAGLVSWIPHYTQTLESGHWKKGYYSDQEKRGYSIQVAKDMYAMNTLPDSVWKWTIESELRPLPYGKKKYDYKYSDLGMYMLRRLIEKVVNQPMNEFLEQNFFEPLGLYTLTYLPLEKYGPEDIAPTENDQIFRKSTIQGYVHDPGAAMLGGVGGHAGLFGTANDLAVMMQMMLQGGNYGGVNLLDAKTVKEFTQRQSDQSRRAWGWDKPEPEPDKGGGAGKLSPKSSFGHTGFTGTAVWADPKNELIYVFLSNRVHPDASNNSLLTDDVRTDIHDIIYRSLKEQ